MSTRRIALVLALSALSLSILPGVASGSAAAGSTRASVKVTEFPLPTPSSRPYQIVAGPDGNLWFTERFADLIAKFNPNTGQLLAEYSIPTENAQPWGITAGPDGALWFTEEDVDQIGRMTTNGQVFELPTQSCCFPTFITTGADGRLWFTLNDAGKVAGINPSGGSLGVFPGGSYPIGITPGPDGNIWFTESQSNAIGRVELG